MLVSKVNCVVHEKAQLHRGPGNLGKGHELVTRDQGLVLDSLWVKLLCMAESTKVGEIRSLL